MNNLVGDIKWDFWDLYEGEHVVHGGPFLQAILPMRYLYIQLLNLTFILSMSFGTAGLFFFLFTWNLDLRKIETTESYENKGIWLHNT